MIYRRRIKELRNNSSYSRYNTNCELVNQQSLVMYQWEQFITTLSVLFSFLIIYRMDGPILLNYIPTIGRETVHLHNLSYQITPSTIDCSRNVLFIVLSSKKSLNQRMAIRSTWARQDRLKRNNATLFFLLGRHDNNNDDQGYDSEANLFQDILYDDSISEERLSHPSLTVSGLHWAIHRCPSIPYLVKSDDGNFVKWSSFHRIISLYPSDRPLIWGRVIERDVPQRDPMLATHFISERDFPENSYPKYIKGPMYCMSNAAAVMISLAVKNFPLDYRRFPREDIFLTGLVAESCGIPRHHSDFFNCIFGPVAQHYVAFSFPGNRTEKEPINISGLSSVEMRQVQSQNDYQGLTSFTCNHQITV